MFISFVAKQWYKGNSMPASTSNLFSLGIRAVTTLPVVLLVTANPEMSDVITGDSPC